MLGSSVAGVLTLLVALVASPSTGRAQVLDGQTFLFGTTALGTGGATGAVSTDATALYYNPGGLAFGTGGSVSTSITFSVFNENVVRDGFVTGAGSANLVLEDIASFPFYVGGAVQFGAKAPDGRRRHSVGFATFTPNNVRARFSGVLPEEGTTEPPGSSLRIGIRSRNRWYGVGYAYRLVEQLGIGFSAFFIDNVLLHEEDQSDVSASQLAARSSTVKIPSSQLVFRFGLNWRVERHVQLGLTFQPPDWQLRARGRVDEFLSQATVGDPDPPPVSVTTLEGLPADQPLPWRLRLAGSVAFDFPLRLELDAILSGRLGRADNPVQVIDGVPPRERPLPEATGIYFAQTFTRNFTVDLALGGEGIVADRVPISAGIFTSVGNRTGFDAFQEDFSPARTDTFGTSLSVGLRGQGYDFSVGVVGIFSTGRFLRAVSTEPQQGLAGYEPVGARSTSVFVFVSGAGGAVTRLADEVTRFVGSDDEESEGSDGSAGDDGAGEDGAGEDSEGGVSEASSRTGSVREGEQR